VADDRQPLLPPLHERDREAALRVGDHEFSYGDLRGAAGAVARRVEGAERVGVWAESTLEACVAIVGALAAGAAVVPVNPKLGDAELRHVLKDSRPDLLLGRLGTRLPARSTGPLAPASSWGSAPSCRWTTSTPSTRR
jgi:malonyl-CoA/methylmalonyl-CoA synthetase